MPTTATRAAFATALVAGLVAFRARPAHAELSVDRVVDLTVATGPLPSNSFADAMPSVTSAPGGPGWIAWIRSESGGGEDRYSVFLRAVDASLTPDPASLSTVRFGPRLVSGVAVSTDGMSPIVYTALGPDGATGSRRGTVVVSRGLTAGAGFEPVPGVGVQPLIQDGDSMLDVFASQRVPPGILEYAFVATRAGLPPTTAAVTVLARTDGAITSGTADAMFRIPDATRVRIAHARSGPESMAVAQFLGTRMESYVPDGGARVPVAMSDTLLPPGLAAHPARSFLVTVGPSLGALMRAPLECLVRDEDAVFGATPDCAAAVGFANSNADLATATDEGAGGTLWASAATCPTMLPAGPGGVIVATPGTGDAPILLVARGFECCSRSSIAPLGADSALVAAACSPALSTGLDSTHVFAWVVRRARVMPDAGADASSDAVEPPDVVIGPDAATMDAADDAATPPDAVTPRDDTEAAARFVVRVRGGACMCRAAGAASPSRTRGSLALTVGVLVLASRARRRRGG